MFKFKDDESINGIYLEDALDEIGNLRTYLSPERELTAEKRDDLGNAGQFVVEHLDEVSAKLAEAEARAANFVGPGARGCRTLPADAPRVDARALRVVVR